MGDALRLHIGHKIPSRSLRETITKTRQARFFPALTFAHLALCAAAIFLRAAVRVTFRTFFLKGASATHSPEVRFSFLTFGATDCFVFSRNLGREAVRAARAL